MQPKETLRPPGPAGSSRLQAAVDGLASALLGDERLQAWPRSERRRWLMAIRATLLMCSVVTLLLAIVRVEDAVGRMLCASFALLLVLFVACFLLTFVSEKEDEAEKPLPKAESRRSERASSASSDDEYLI